jgi:hypothetical protein
MCYSKKEENLVSEKQLLKIQFENVDEAKRFEQTIEAQFQSKV